MNTEKNAGQTPMMQQFYQIKQQHPDKILFYRMGDFYEMFGEDAVTAAKVLQIQLTTRNKNRDDSIPLCGVPIHAYEQYLNKLTHAGFKVAICEQTEDPALAKGLVKREVVRIITPGTVVSPDLLDASANSFLCAVFADLKKRIAGLAFCDLSTGEFEVDEVSLRENAAEVLELIYLYQPREVLLPDTAKEQENLFFCELESQLSQMGPSVGGEPHVERVKDFYFDHRSGDRGLSDHFQVATLAGFGLDNMPYAVSAAGAVLEYLKETQKDTLRHIVSLRRVQKDDRMILDECTVRNLELFDASNNADAKHTLVHLLDNCKTAMGSRKLRRWLAAPLLKKESIERRFDAVEAFINQHPVREQLRELFSQMGDLERIIARIVMPNTSIADVVRLRKSLEPLPEIGDAVKELPMESMKEEMAGFDTLQDLYRLLQENFMEEPSLKIKEGGFIRNGVSEELDKLKDLMKNGKQLIANMEAEEKRKTGITSLKIGFNRVFGYFIEVSNTSKHLVPDDYIRRQTLVNNERYVTEELKELEEDILNAEDQSKTLELQIFREIKEKLEQEIDRIQETARIISEIDVLSTFAHNAVRNNYVRPILDENPNQRVISIREGRHPVIESLTMDEPFIPNDVLLDSRGGFILVITGPNMGGKSTYMRQTALIALMAQIGSFVPAQEARLPIFDRIFTRVGASDNLTRGQSTFMVEMSEAASILNNATERSFIILDEIGRGTSTFDGISIAWAIIEHLHELNALTLFATHYHELILLEQQLKGVCNGKVVVHEENDNMVFLRKVVSGQTDKSYGIQVARLAGLPREVVDRAREVIVRLEMAEKQFNPQDQEQKPCAEQEQPDSVEDNIQLSIFPPEDPWVNEIRKFDVNNSTPVQALQFLADLKQKIG